MIIEVDAGILVKKLLAETMFESKIVKVALR